MQGSRGSLWRMSPGIIRHDLEEELMEQSVSRMESENDDDGSEIVERPIDQPTSPEHISMQPVDIWFFM